MSECTLNATKAWFVAAVPEPTEKNFTTQLGVHLEEVAEMLEALTGKSQTSEDLLKHTVHLLEQLGNHLKNNAGCVTIADHDELLDGICDQLVTGTGVAHMAGYNVVGALEEVNRSNFSKFDEEGKPIFNENGKIMKSPQYSPPNLKPFLAK